MSEHDQHAAAAPETARPGPGLGSDFGLRLISGLGMGAAAAAFVFTGTIPFAILVAAMASLLSWEWSRLVHGQADVVLAVHLAAVLAAVSLAAAGYLGLGVLALAIGAILAMVLSLGQSSIYTATGVFYAGIPAIILIWLRSDVTMGLLAIVFLVLVTIAADTAAFFSGRLIGGPKLWPRLSPNKTWAGLMGALVAGAVVGFCFWFVVPDGSVLRLIATGIVLALVGQGGDLAESALKRRFGAKDSGTLIPGHGGVMDRLDSLLAAAVAAGLVGMAINVHAPARALLIGW